MKLKVTAIALCLFAIATVVMFNPTPVVKAVGPSASFLINNSGDPCSNPNVAKTYAAVNISGAAGTTELVAASAGKVVYMCGLVASVVGTSPTIQFATGTKVTNPCDTGAANQSGTYAIVSTSLTKLELGGGGTLLTGASGGELCLVAGGTTPSIQGNLTYVQQ